MSQTHWQVTSPKNPSSVEELLGLLLENRKMDPSCLNGSLKDLEAHLAMDGMEAGSRLMSRHLHRRSKIVLVGDYDCDGVTAVSQMALFLRDIGYSEFEVVIPDRSDGYGFPSIALEQHPDARLFVALDCGTSDVPVIERARSSGADVIVLDHHEVPRRGHAPASVLINPKKPGCPSPFKDFCASGLTLLFLAQLRRVLPRAFTPPSLGGKYLALAALGTVADVVPLVHANRILVRSGLSCLNARTFQPLNALIQQAGLWQRSPLTAGHLAFYLAPRINAAGRMEHALSAYRLFMAESSPTLQDCAQRLNALNAHRQKAEEEILSVIRTRWENIRPGRRSLVLGDPAWPAGLAGILASRLQRELHYGPTVVFSVDTAKGTARGSARSIPGVNIYEALGQCADLLLKWGGHEQAAGMTLAADRIEAFADRLEAVMQTYPAHCFVPVRKIDALINLDLVNDSLLDALQRLEPHGMGNPTPAFGVRGAAIRSAVPFGQKGDHVRLRLGNGLEGIFWRGAGILDLPSLNSSTPQDLAFHIERDSYSGAPILNLKAVGELF